MGGILTRFGGISKAKFPPPLLQTHFGEILTRWAGNSETGQDSTRGGRFGQEKSPGTGETHEIGEILDKRKKREGLHR